MWELYGIASGSIFTLSILVRKYLFLKKYSTKDILFFYFLGTFIASCVMLTVLCPTKNKIKSFDKKFILLAFFSGFVVTFGAFFKTNAYRLVNNVTYVETFTVVYKTILLLLFSFLLFNISCNKMTIIGILFSLIGVYLVLRYQ